MTIALSANTPRVSYTVNQGATQTAFTVNFEFFDDADLNFYVDGTLKTLTTHYTVSGGDGSTGTINTTAGNTVTGASGGSTVVITRDIALARTTDFPSSGAFEVATLNTELDRFTAIASDISDETTRSIQLADDDTAVSMVLPLKASRVGTVLGFNATTGAVEAGPNITAVQSLSAVTTAINLLGTSAVVEDLGLLGTSVVIEDMGLLATSGNITAMGLLGVSGVITDMGILGTTAIVEDMGFLGTSANVTAMDVLATSANVTAMGKLGNDTTVADMAILGTDAIVADMAILANSTIVDDLAILATSDIVDDMALLGTSANVTAMGLLGTSANVTAQGLLGVSGVITDMGLLGTSAVVEDMGLLATSAVIEDMGLLATSAVIEDMGLLATSAIIEDMGLLATSVVIEDMGLLATSANVTNMGTLGASGVVANIATVASNVAGVTSFAEKYRVATSAPSASLNEGDLYYDTNANSLNYYNGSAWVAVVAGAMTSLATDTTPQLGGNLDVQTNSIVSTTNRNIAITPNGSGKVVLDGLSYPTADGSNGQVITTNGSGVLSFGSVDAFPSGTSMLFQQTSAPTGWTKSTTHNDKALRLTSGTVGTGGSVAFATALGAGATVAGGSVSGNPTTNIASAAGNLAVSVSGNIADTTLSINQIPSHSHSFTYGPGAEGYNNIGNWSVSNNLTKTTTNAGGGASHTHTHNLSGSMSGAPSISGNVTSGNLAVGASTAAINVQYVDFIIANKD